MANSAEGGFTLESLTRRRKEKDMMASLLASRDKDKKDSSPTMARYMMPLNRTGERRRSSTPLIESNDNDSSSSAKTESADPTPLESDYQVTTYRSCSNDSNQGRFKHSETGHTTSSGSLGSILKNFRKSVNAKSKPRAVSFHTGENFMLIDDNKKVPSPAAAEMKSSD